VRTGTWEPGEGRLLRSLLQPKSRFLDVGANVGYFTAMAAKHCPRGSIDSVEPDPRNAACLELNVWALAPHATIHRAALGPRRDVVALTFDHSNSGNTRIAERVAPSGAHVPMITADELFPHQVFDVVKIDVQGYEDQVLLGMRKLLRRSPDVCVVAEFYPSAIRERGEHPVEVLRTYRALGLDRVVCVEDRLERLEDEQVLALCAAAGREGFVNLLLRRS
jgi:FkbM family methyltransferase